MGGGLSRDLPSHLVARGGLGKGSLRGERGEENINGTQSSRVVEYHSVV